MNVGPSLRCVTQVRIMCQDQWRLIDCRVI